MIEKRLIAKPLIKKIYAELKEEIAAAESAPQLVIILIGADPASEFYVSNLQKKGKKVGINVTTKTYADDISQAEILAEIENLNQAQDVHGIMLQKPLPAQLDESQIVMKIAADKDVDGFHPLNMGNLVLARDGFIPSTPNAVLQILQYYQIETNGKNVCVLGRSDIVGKPLANLLLRKDETGNATVTICHSRTQDLAEHTRQADILIAAIGQPEFVKGDMIKPGAIVIDVGVNQIEDAEKGHRYVGDVDYEACFEKSKAITPVPGGVGSVTTAMLLSNVLKAYKKCFLR
ncbi:MAG: bifunctional 5,10-methylenetetrahydrofolate dehydrogenase/5,10-methenyltetrahydrofolate cyclohydrolase [Candidatus Cloacimonadales bacterium]